MSLKGVAAAGGWLAEPVRGGGSAASQRRASSPVAQPQSAKRGGYGPSS